MTTRASERRKVVRYTVRVPIKINQIGTGCTIDISTTGVAFLIDRELEPGIEIRFELALDEEHALLTCDGHVVRSEQRASAGHFTAATIENLAVRPAIEH